MKVVLLHVGRAKGSIGEAIEEFEKRVSHYFSFESISVKETAFKGQPIPQLLEDEGKRLLARVQPHNELIALHRPGKQWSSEGLAEHLSSASMRSVPGLTFVIGGAYGLSAELIGRADRLFSLSAMTLTHDMARLVLTEQLYRAGTILRGEPYHKGLAG
jgi:23S rRNA (pseudouridine1915-N3)-methyltransferase